MTGDVVLDARADVEVARSAAGYEISVRRSGSTLLHVTGHEQRFDSSTRPLTLHDTALHAELGIGSGAVTAHVSDALVLDVAALPGPALDVVGVSGMTGSFHYASSWRADDDD